MPQHRQDEKADAMYELYQAGFSLSRVAASFGITRQSAYKMFKRRGFPLRKKQEPLPFVVFQGGRYTLRNNGYYGRTNGKRTLLHRDMWESAHGQIPAGFDIHHIDGDKANNCIENFECIPKDEHSRRYPGRQNQYTKR